MRKKDRISIAFDMYRDLLFGLSEAEVEKTFPSLPFFIFERMPSDIGIRVVLGIRVVHGICGDFPYCLSRPRNPVDRSLYIIRSFVDEFRGFPDFYLFCKGRYHHNNLHRVYDYTYYYSSLIRNSDLSVDIGDFLHGATYQGFSAEEYMDTLCIYCGSQRDGSSEYCFYCKQEGRVFGEP